MNISGIIEVIKETQVISETFKKREFVINTGGDYPELIQLEMIKDKCANLDNNQPGQLVDVSFNLKGRKWTNPQGVDKYFNTCQAWMVKVSQQNQPAPQPQYQTPPVGQSVNQSAPVQAAPIQAGDVPVAGGVAQDDVPFNSLGNFDQ